MAINSDDFVGALLNEQARLNFLADTGDVNNLVADLNGLAEPIGVGSTETVNTITTVLPHKYDDTPANNTVWGFFQFS